MLLYLFFLQGVKIIGDKRSWRACVATSYREKREEREFRKV
jgi:hypothetical protein